MWVFNERVMSSLLKNKNVGRLVKNMEKVAAQLLGFIDTYMGVYDDKGNQIEKGDRDYFSEAFDRIEKKLAEIENRLSVIEDKLNQG